MSILYLKHDNFTSLPSEAFQRSISGAGCLAKEGHPFPQKGDAHEHKSCSAA